MGTYHITVKDGSGSPVSFAKIYTLDGPAGNGILFGGVPVAFETDVTGTYTVDNANPQIYARIEATGYQSKNVTLTPGVNDITLDVLTGPTAVIAGAQTFFNKYKVFILLALTILMFYLALKYKVLK